MNEKRYYKEMYENCSISYVQKKSIEKEDWSNKTDLIREIIICDFDAMWWLSFKEQKKLKRAIEKYDCIEMNLFKLKDEFEEDSRECVLYFNFPNIIDRVIRAEFSSSSAFSFWLCNMDE